MKHQSLSDAEIWTEQLLIALRSHGFLTTSQIRALIEPNLNKHTFRRRYRRAKTLGLVDSVRPASSGESRWYLTALGVEATAGRVEEPVDMTAGIAVGALAPHLWSVNQFGITVVEAMRCESEGSADWKHEVQLPLGSGRSLRPDAILSVLYEDAHEATRSGLWFVELDRGTEQIGRLVDKVVNYLAYREHKSASGRSNDSRLEELDWRRRFRSWPTITFVFDCGNARRRMEHLADQLAADPRLAGHLHLLPIIAGHLPAIMSRGATADGALVDLRSYEPVTLLNTTPRPRVAAS